MTLAHGALSLAEKSFLLGDVFTGEGVLVDHTVAALARYGEISPAYIHAALQRRNERVAIEAGFLPLIPPPSPAVLAERKFVKLVRELGHGRVAELLTRFAPAITTEPGNDNSVPRESDAASSNSAA
jgi:hypothetical protein